MSGGGTGLMSGGGLSIGSGGRGMAAGCSSMSLLKCNNFADGNSAVCVAPFQP
jgi:hypothetical protein